MSASAGDSRFFPVYASRYRVVFPILDADGDLVTAAAALDSEVSKDQGTFADCTNEATEIATSSGVYYLDLTAAEMTAKSVTVIVKTTTSGAKTTVLTLYPLRIPVVRAGTAQAGASNTITLDAGASAKDDFYNGCYVNITNDTPSGVVGQLRRIIDYAGSTKVATVDSNWGTNPSSSSTFEVLLSDQVVGAVQWAGTAVLDPATLGQPEVRAAALANDVVTAAAIAADAITAAKLAADVETELRAVATGTADSGTTTTAVDAERTEADTDYWKGCLILFTSGTIAGQVRLITGFNPATDTITFAPATTQAVGTNTYEIVPAGRADVQLWLGALVNALISGRVDANALAPTLAELSQAAPPATPTLEQAVMLLYMALRNQRLTTATEEKLTNDAGAVICKSALSDDGTTFARAELVSGP